jgi:hypothetical protein
MANITVVLRGNLTVAKKVYCSAEQKDEQKVEKVAGKKGSCSEMTLADLTDITKEKD